MAFFDVLGNFEQKEISGIFKRTFYNRTFECLTNNCTTEVQAPTFIPHKFICSCKKDKKNYILWKLQKSIKDLNINEYLVLKKNTDR